MLCFQCSCHLNVFNKIVRQENQLKFVTKIDYTLSKLFPIVSQKNSQKCIFQFLKKFPKQKSELDNTFILNFQNFTESSRQDGNLIILSKFPSTRCKQN